jgi:thiol-disulfide isomerase/thioredoxin
MRLKSALVKEITFPKALVTTGSLLMVGLISVFGIVLFGPAPYLTFLLGLCLVNYLVSARAGQRLLNRLRVKPKSADSRIVIKGMTAEQFLKWAMDRYEAMAQFQMNVDIGGSHGAGTRKFFYKRPNKYLVVSLFSNGHTMMSVSDGKRIVEYSFPASSEPRTYPVPDSISSAHSMFMTHPMFCGSLIYRFFGGGKNLDSLADLAKRPVEYGGEEIDRGELSREVNFYGVEMYGNMRALIGTESGKVYRIAYDSEPLVQMMNDPSHRAQMQRTYKAQIAKEQDPEKRAEMEEQFQAYIQGLEGGPQAQQWTTHEYRDIEVDGDVPDSIFDTTPPDGAEPIAHDEAPRPPAPIGEPAPDAVVRDLDGREFRLTDFRGKVLMIDLWATWCGPCRKGLPDTAKLAKAGKSEGFEVLAVSNEDPELIREFLREEGLQDLPAYVDSNGELWQNYKVSAIPTVVVIDPKGNLSAYLVGLQPVSKLRSAIKEARK